MLPRPALTFALALFLCPAVAHAQASPPVDAESAAPAHVSHVEGTVILERDGRPENSPLNMPLLSGDRLRTQDGRVEVLFADGSALHLDARTTLDVQSDDLVRLIDGRLRLAIAGPSRAVAYRIDSPAGSVRISQSGDYRISMLHGENETQLELAVVRGSGEIFTDEGSTPVRAGERAYASAGLAPSYAYSYNSANWDAFDRWSESRRDTRLGVSAQYLPEDVRPYSSTFDEYGDWRYQQSYGYVWYPRVAVGWRPYYYGRWASYPRYGWTWIGADAFAWPTHHYGRWGFSSGVWFWIPSSRWAPAYVSWAYAPGYVSWCPLGFDNRPVISINIFNVRPGFYSSSRAWTAVSSSHFGRSYYVHQRAVNWDRWDRRTTFQAGRTAPGGRDIAVPRGSTATPIRWVGRRAEDGARSSDVGARSSDAGPRASDLGRRTSDAGPRTSDLGRRTSDAGPRASDVGPRPADAGAPSSGLRAQPSRDTAVPRSGEAPRYINRGDAIVRSRTERPTAPAPRGDATVRGGAEASRSDLGASRGDVAVPRGEAALQRTTPAGAARRVDDASQIGGSAARDDRRPDVAGLDRAMPRRNGTETPSGAERRPYGARPDARPYTPPAAPSYGRPDVRGYPRTEPSTAGRSRDDGAQPRTAEPRGAEPRGDAPAYRPRSSEPSGRAPDAAPREYARPRGGDDPRPAPSGGYGARPSPGGGYTPPSQPSGGSGARQAPPSPRAAPSGGGEGRAVPRSAPPSGGGGQARPRGGRGGH